jgi:hypothetical protein
MTARYGDDKLDREGTPMNAKEATDEHGLTWIRFNLSSVICHLFRRRRIIRAAAVCHQRSGGEALLLD